MSGKFTAAQAKNLIQYHQDTAQRLEQVSAEAERCFQSIGAALDRMAAEQVFHTLKAIPVEEINRDKLGFRVKALREQGFNSMADLAAADQTRLAAVKGISPEGAAAIRQIVERTARQARSGIRISLSADDRSPAATELVKSIFLFRRCKPLASECHALKVSCAGAIGNAITALRPAASRLKWFFTGKEKKTTAQQAHELLAQLRDGEYGQRAKKALDDFSGLRRLSDDAAWQDFMANAIAYFTLIGDIRPELVSGDDQFYGLPEELAQKIAQEPFHPEGLKLTLRPYQLWGVKYALHQKRALLGDEMGLGKTVQAIAAMVSLRNEGNTHFAVLCPASVITNWCREIETHSDLTVIRIHGADRQQAMARWVSTGGVAVTTFETTAFLRPPEDFRFTLLVVDEAHYIKNPQAQRTVNAKRLAAHAQRLLLMTGTALENRVEEMVELSGLLQPQVAAAVRGMEALSSAPQFRKAVAPVYYRRKREDVLTELPELIETQQWCTMTRAEQAVYERAVLNRDFTGARRVSWNVDRLEDSSKASRLLEIVEDAQEDGRKVIVFSFFLDTIRRVTALLAGRCLEPINGAVPPARRQEILDRFQQAPAGTVLAAQIQSGGTGLNIQCASVVVLCEPQFKPSIENQAISRAYRMGQARNVLVYRLLCAHTVEEQITALLQDKQQIFDAFADESLTASNTRELDERGFGAMMEEEYRRISARQEPGLSPAAQSAAQGPAGAT